MNSNGSWKNIHSLPFGEISKQVFEVRLLFGPFPMNKILVSHQKPSLPQTFFLVYHEFGQDSGGREARLVQA